MTPESHTLILRPDGTLVVPDLADGLTAVAGALGDERPRRLPSTLGPPRLARARRIRLPLPAAPEALSEAELWAWHEAGAQAFRAGRDGGGGVGWLAVKQELARRLLGGPCRLCARRCRVDRAAGETGFCGLGPGLRVAAPLRLWGEEAELGTPGLALPAIGCALRCRFCYRPEHLPSNAGAAADPAALAAAIDAADDVEHVHFLGGDPDESLPGILAVLARVSVERPIVWNTHSYLTTAGAALLEGVVDAAVADLKFGPGSCDSEVAGVSGYWAAATRTLSRLHATGVRLIVRHVALPGHLECCAAPASHWARERLPGARVRVLEQYEPFGRAWADKTLNRRLDAAERARVRALQQEREGS